MLRNTSGFWIVVALALSSSLITPSWGRANERVSEFNIPPQALDSALLVFAEQADVQVSVSTVAIAGMKTQGVVGRFTPSVALSRLLATTGLRFSTVGDRTYAVSLAANAKDSPSGMLHAGEEPIWSDGVMLLAQAPTNSNRTNEVATNQDPDTKPQRSDPVIAEVIVTGTHIRGQQPVGGQLITIDRQDIDKGGFSTAQDLVRSLPQNFGGGPSEDTNLGLEARTNAAKSTALNLRGLGAGSTLVLVNGRRLAAAGGEGTFIDVSSIPLTAIERVDVLTDGASAIYGSDAVGGVVNFIMRRDYKGAETQARFGSVTESSLREYQFSQALGTAWASGHAYLSYEYYKRDSLAATERELTADSDLTALGGGNFSSRQSNPGNITIGSQIWAIPRGQDGTSLQPSDLVAGSINFRNLNEERDLYFEQERHGAFVAASQTIGDRVEVFAEALLAKRDLAGRSAGLAGAFSVPNTNPFYVHPTGGTAPVRVQYNFGDDLGPRTLSAQVETSSTAIGLAVDAGKDWRVNLAGNYGLEKVDQVQGNSVDFAALAVALADPNPATAFNPFADGSSNNPATLDAIRVGTLFATDSDLRSGNITASGSLFRMGGGETKLAIGADYREQSFKSFSSSIAGSDSVEFTRRVSASFVELLVPLFSAENRRRGLELLELSLAARRDDYDDFGSTTNPKVGALWSPVTGFALRGTWGTSFKAPNLADLDESANVSFIFSIPDPQSPTGESPVLDWFGKNADLKEETATVWTFGATLDPEAFPGFRAGVSYYEIEFEDRIQQAPGVNSFLTDAERFAGIVTRDPTAEQRAVVCSRSAFIGDPADCLDAPIAAIVDARTNNTSIVKTSGIDLIGSYEFATKRGTFDLGVNATYLLEFSEAQTPTAPEIELIDTVSNPVRFRARSSLSWDHRGFGATAFVNYVGSYTDNLSTPRREIDSWTTTDLQLRYRSDAASWLDGIFVALNVQNLFDEDPPFVNNSAGVGYDRENADLLGRFVSLQLRKEW